MNKQNMGLLALLLCQACLVHAQGAKPASILEEMIKRAMAPQAMLNGTYTDYHFNSTNGTRFNRYSGHNANVTLGELNRQLTHQLKLSVSFLGSDAKASGRSRLDATTNAFSQSSHSAGATANLTYQLATRIPAYVNVFANYSISQNSLSSSLAVNTDNAQTGRANYAGNALALGGSTAVSYQHRHWRWLGNVAYWYSRGYQAGYQMTYGVNTR